MTHKIRLGRLVITVRIDRPRPARAVESRETKVIKPKEKK